MTDAAPNFAPNASPDPVRLGPYVVERAGLRLLRDDVDTGTDGQASCAEAGQSCS